MQCLISELGQVSSLETSPGPQGIVRGRYDICRTTSQCMLGKLKAVDATRYTMVVPGCSNASRI